jgi:hypothetical protein
VNDAEARFAELLAEDLERVLGAGIAIDDVEISTLHTSSRVVATLLVDGRVETVEAEGSSLIDLYRPLVERAAELRLAAAFWRMIGPA